MSGNGGYDQYNASPYGSQQYQEDPYAAPPPPPAHRQPGMHANSNFTRMQDERQYGVPSQNAPPYSEMSRSPPRRPVGASPINRDQSPSPPMHFGGMPAYPPPTSRTPHQSSPQPRGPSPPRQNQYGAAAVGAGAVAGMGAGYAAGNMMHNDHLPQQPGNMGQYSHMAYSEPSEHEYDGAGPYRQGMQSHDSYGSDAGLAAYAGTTGSATPRRADAGFAQYQDYSSPSPSRHLNPNQYNDHSLPTSRSHDQMATAAYINPNEILDDGDDFPVHPKRASRVNLAFNKSKSSVNATTAAGAGLGAGAIGDDMAGGFNRDPSGNYSSIPANRLGAIGEEKSSWMQENAKDGRRKKKILFIVAGIIIIAGIIAGTVAGVMSQNRSGGSSSSNSQAESAAADAAKGDLNKDSAEIKKLLNNPDMHKVFAGFAYTPLHAQYPDCLTAPPIQNNVTRDMALLGQLTNVVRMYGTDCNQTEMVLHAIDRLELNDMKIWLGVWLGNNATTNARQVDQMWKILEDYGTDHVKGVVIGNEVLFRQDLTATQLGTYLSQTKTNLTAKGYNLPVATSDLGDNWTAALAAEVDVVMSNIHPFFGGVTVQEAAGWTYSFWQNHDVSLTAGMADKAHVISEFGWPSEGGNKCGAAKCTSDTQGSVASIPNMNILMDDWVCEALSNGTDYFWFEAFDEPWKVRFNTEDEQWEDKWGLMDVNRNLKPGVKIPDCGGATAPAA